MTRMAQLVVFLLLSIVAAGAAQGQSVSADVGEMWGDLQQANCFSVGAYTAEDVLRYSSDILCRFRAVRYLGLAGDRRAVPALEAAYREDSDPGVRSQALVELIRLGQRQYADVARESMQKSTSLAAKAGLAGQLAEAGDASGLPHVLEACRSQETQDRQTCATALGMFRKLAAKDPKLLTTLLDQILVLAEDQDTGVRHVSMLAAASLSRAMALPKTFVAQLDVLAGRSEDGEVQRLIRNIYHSQESHNR